MLSPHHTFQTILFSFLFCGAALIAVKAAVREPTAVPTAASGTPSAVVMIDPGHGGEDGGASDGGVLEKGLNLAVAADLADYLPRAEDRLGFFVVCYVHDIISMVLFGL